MHSDTTIISKIEKLIEAHKQGRLGGEKMPEDSRPDLDKNSEENLLYLTLPMALNYQRNSYKLWESALLTWQDPETRFIFQPKKVLSTAPESLQAALLKYKVALQPNKHPEIWLKISSTICQEYDGRILNLLADNNFDIDLILTEIQKTKKPGFPYLSGNKIANYWLFVLTQYTNLPFKNRKYLSIAPDTHIQQASIYLGLSNAEHNAIEIAKRWQDLLKNTTISPIDVHTPLWLWSRSGFAFELQ